MTVQLVFKAEPDGEYVGGKLVCNYAKRTARAEIPIQIADYPDVIRNLLLLEKLPESGIKELLAFFTGLNNKKS